jgi:hypothetical protein
MRLCLLMAPCSERHPRKRKRHAPTLQMKGPSHARGARRRPRHVCAARPRARRRHRQNPAGHRGAVAGAARHGKRARARGAAAARGGGSVRPPRAVVCGAADAEARAFTQRRRRCRECSWSRQARQYNQPTAAPSAARRDVPARLPPPPRVARARAPHCRHSGRHGRLLGRARV